MDILLVPDPASPNREDAFCREIAKRAAARGHKTKIQAVPNGPLETTLEALCSMGFARGYGLTIINSLQPAALLAAERAHSLTAVRIIDSYFTASASALDQVKRMVLQANLVFVPSRYMSQLFNDWGVPKERLWEVPYAYDKIMAREIALVNLKTARQASFPITCCLPLNEKTKIGIETLLMTLSRLRLDWHLSVIGDGPALPDLIATTIRLCVAARVTFAGNLAYGEIMEHFRASKAFIDPCGLEGFPSMALYALSEGCPVIAAKCAAVPELIRNGENGLLYLPDNPASLGDLLARLRSETGLSLRIIGSGIKTVGEHSWDATVAAVFSAVDSLENQG